MGCGTTHQPSTRPYRLPLRKAINLGRNPDPIRTVRGAEYALDERFAVS
jgi:hypothetical protein